MEFKHLIIDVKEHVAKITLHRPKALNALNAELISELSNALDTLENDNEIRAIIITGAGEKAFVAGADIKEFSDFTPEKGKELSKIGHDSLFNKISNLSKPVIAAINGFALGGGLELALSCHIRIASENARLGLPEVTLGLIPGYGGTQRLTQIIGKGRALQFILTAEHIKAHKAHEMGLVNEVVAQETLLDKAIEMANKIAANSPMAIRKAIKSVNAAEYKNGYDVEIESFGQLFQSEDFKEGVGAFLEKRKPNF